LQVAKSNKSMININGHSSTGDFSQSDCQLSRGNEPEGRSRSLDGDPADSIRVARSLPLELRADSFLLNEIVMKLLQHLHSLVVKVKHYGKDGSIAFNAPAD